MQASRICGGRRTATRLAAAEGRQFLASLVMHEEAGDWARVEPGFS